MKDFLTCRSRTSRVVLLKLLRQGNKRPHTGLIFHFRSSPELSPRKALGSPRRLQKLNTGEGWNTIAGTPTHQASLFGQNENHRSLLGEGGLLKSQQPAFTDMMDSGTAIQSGTCSRPPPAGTSDSSIAIPQGKTTEQLSRSVSFSSPHCTLNIHQQVCHCTAGLWGGLTVWEIRCSHRGRQTSSVPN